MFNVPFVMIGICHPDLPSRSSYHSLHLCVTAVPPGRWLLETLGLVSSWATSTSTRLLRASQRGIVRPFLEVSIRAPLITQPPNHLTRTSPPNHLTSPYISPVPGSHLTPDGLTPRSASLLRAFAGSLRVQRHDARGPEAPQRAESPRRVATDGFTEGSGSSF